MTMKISSTDRRKQPTVAAEPATMKPPRPEAGGAHAATENRVPDAERMSRRALFLRLGAWVRASLDLLDGVPAAELSPAGRAERATLRVEGKPLQNSAAMGAKDPARQNAPRLLRLIRNWLGRIRNWGQQHLSPGRHRRQLEDKLGRVEEKLDGVQADVGGLKAGQARHGAILTSLEKGQAQTQADVGEVKADVGDLKTEAALALEQAVMNWLDVDFDKMWHQTMNAHPQESNPERCPGLSVVPHVWHDRQPRLTWESIRPGLYIASDVKSEDLPCDLLVRCQYRLSSGQTQDFLVVGEASRTIHRGDIQRIRAWRTLLAGALAREGLPIALPVVPILFSEHRDLKPVSDILYLHRGGAYRFQRDPEFRTKMRRLLGWDA